MKNLLRKRTQVRTSWGYLYISYTWSGLQEINAKVIVVFYRYGLGAEEATEEVVAEKEENDETRVHVVHQSAHASSAGHEVPPLERQPSQLKQGNSL